MALRIVFGLERVLLPAESHQNNGKAGATKARRRRWQPRILIIYRHYSAANTLLDTDPSELAGNHFNDLVFTDNITGTLVGDNGAYFTTTNPAIDPDGYLIGVEWKQKTVTASNDPLGATAMDIYTIGFATPTSGAFAGTYTAGSYTHPYVRKVFDASERYSNRFFYDRLGRLVVSQNARQYNGAERKYSYTLYDPLGRVIEAGEKTENDGGAPRFASIFGTNVSNFFNPAVIDDSLLNNWITASGARKEVTRSYYDSTLITGLPTEFATDHATQNKRIVHVTFEEEYDGNDQTYDHATHYRYDIHGNVKTLLQDNRKMAVTYPSIAAQRFKRMDYAYDLVSGNVHRMSVQNGQPDQWHHAFVYDADNRITQVYTSTTTPLVSINGLAQDMQNELQTNSDWQNDARYFYYDHGPLARVEIGQNNLQGVDYYYNLQGWLKGVNSSVLDHAHDPGTDSDPNSINALFAKDVFGFGLQYYTGDYTAINGTGQQAHATVNATSHAANNSSDLYNGNIRSMQTALTHPQTRAKMPMLNAYKYDQLNRLTESRSYETGLASNVWNPVTYNNEYFNAFTYDASGNILTQKRHKRDGTEIEDLTYRYHLANGKLIRDRLYHVNDGIASNVDSTDIDDMGTFYASVDSINVYNNYRYDEEGRLVHDRQEEIDTIIWTVSGKVKEIRRPSTSSKKSVTFDYDAFDRRITKHVFNPQTDMLEKSTYYLLDAQGQQLSMYEHTVDTSEVKYHLAERNIYGSSRLGTTKDTVNMYTPQLLPSYGVMGNRNYELSNHLGNVLTVINDHIIQLDEDNDDEVDGYQVSLAMVADYSAFGVQLDGRTIGESTRYGFGSQERDDEVSGAGNSYTAEFWQYSPRIVKRWNVDPMTAKYPWQSPYSVFNNNPIIFNDPLGLEGQDWIGRKNADGSVGWKWDDNVKSKDQLPEGWTHYAAPGTKKTATNGMEVLLGDNGQIDYLDKTEAGNYISQEGIELQWSGEDEANAIFREKMKGLSNALDNLKLGMGATLAAPFVIGGAIMAAPVVGSLGGFGTTLTGSSLLRSGLINAGTNALSQLATNGFKPKEIDVASVLISGVSGRFFKSKPTLNIVTTSFLDASLDIKLSGKFDYIGEKDWGELGIDFGVGMLNGTFNKGMNEYPMGYEFLGTGVINTGTNALQKGFTELYND